MAYRPKSLLISPQPAPVTRADETQENYFTRAWLPESAHHAE